MQPVQCNVPGREADEIIYAKDQPEYSPLPTLLSEDGCIVITRWTFTPEERAQIAAGADMWLSVMTFGSPLQPLRPSLKCPVEPKQEPA